MPYPDFMVKRQPLTKDNPMQVNGFAKCPLTLLHDKLAVVVEKRPTKTKGGLHLPDGAEYGDRQSLMATVVALGTGVMPDGKTVEFHVKVGDQVFLDNTAGGRLIVVDKVEYCIIKEYSILAIAPATALDTESFDAPLQGDD